MLSEARLEALKRKHRPFKPDNYCLLCSEIWPCETALAITELRRLRPVVEAATEWHTTREAVAKLDQISGSEWFVQMGVVMRAHQQAADKLAAVVAALAGEGER